MKSLIAMFLISVSLTVTSSCASAPSQESGTADPQAAAEGDKKKKKEECPILYDPFAPHECNAMRDRKGED